MLWRARQVIVDLGRVRDRLDPLADGGQRPRDEVGRPLPPEAKHHRGSDVVGGLAVVALEVAPGSPGDDVAAGKEEVLEAAFFVLAKGGGG